MEMAPADSPKTVTREGSPPGLIVSICRAKREVRLAELRDVVLYPLECESLIKEPCINK
jgi:hypothetical protein